MSSTTTRSGSRSNKGENARKVSGDAEVIRFQTKYLYRYLKKQISHRDGTLQNSNIAIFGLQNGSGLKVFNEYFPSKSSSEVKKKAKYDGKVEIKVKVVSSQYEEEPAKVLVNPTQCGTHLLPFTAYEVLQEFDTGVSCFVVVFDAGFHRFSSDCARSLALMESCFGTRIWDFTALLIADSDKLLQNKTLTEYFDEDEENKLVLWAGKMGKGVLALPSSHTEYSKKFVRGQVASLVRHSASFYNPDLYRRVRWWVYSCYNDVKNITLL